MWSPSKIACGRRWLGAAAVALSLALPSLAAAAPGPQSNEPSSAAERQALRQQVEKAYEVLPVSGGVLLKPRLPLAGVKSVEIKGAEVNINGERVSSRTLTDWLGDKADPVLRLQRLSPPDRLALLGIARPKVGTETEGEIPAVGEEGDSRRSGDAVPERPEADERPEAPEIEETPAEPAVPEEPAEPAPSETRSGRNVGERVNIGGGVTVEKGERAEQVVAIGGPARVEGEVEQDVVSVGSSVHVDGKVGGEVVSVGGTVYLGPHAEIDGNVTSVGGRIQRQPGAVIHGDTSEVGLFPMLGELGGFRGGRHRWDRHFGGRSMFGGFGDFVGSLTCFVLLALLCCLVILIARQPLERVLRQLRAQPWQSAGVGFAAALTFWPLFAVVTILLAVTIVGCLLIALYPFLFLFLGLVALLGFTAVAVRIGEAVEERFNLKPVSPYVAALIGVLVLGVGSILSSLLDWIGGPVEILGFAFGLFGFLAQGVAWIVGFGAVLLARFGTSPGYWPKSGPPPIPVVPASPGYTSSYGVPVVPNEPGAPSDELPLSHVEPPAEAEEGSQPPPTPAG